MRLLVFCSFFIFSVFGRATEVSFEVSDSAFQFEQKVFARDAIRMILDGIALRSGEDLEVPTVWIDLVIRSLVLNSVNRIGVSNLEAYSLFKKENKKKIFSFSGRKFSKQRSIPAFSIKIETLPEEFEVFKKQVRVKLQRVYSGEIRKEYWKKYLQAWEWGQTIHLDEVSRLDSKEEMKIKKEVLKIKSIPVLKTKLVEIPSVIESQISSNLLFLEKTRYKEEYQSLLGRVISLNHKDLFSVISLVEKSRFPIIREKILFSFLEQKGIEAKIQIHETHFDDWKKILEKQENWKKGKVLSDAQWSVSSAFPWIRIQNKKYYLIVQKNDVQFLDSWSEKRLTQVVRKIRQERMMRAFLAEKIHLLLKKHLIYRGNEKNRERFEQIKWGEVLMPKDTSLFQRSKLFYEAIF